MEQWLENITTILRHPKYPQIKGDLEKKEGKKIIGKCALGELRCQSGVKSMYDIVDSEGKIMKACGVPEDLRGSFILPSLEYETSNNPDEPLKIVDVNNDKYDTINLQSWIYKLNDCGYTYPQICEFLEVTFDN